VGPKPGSVGCVPSGLGSPAWGPWCSGEVEPGLMIEHTWRLRPPNGPVVGNRRVRTIRGLIGAGYDADEEGCMRQGGDVLGQLKGHCPRPGAGLTGVRTSDAGMNPHPWALVWELATSPCVQYQMSLPPGCVWPCCQQENQL
jgi:hypothetical protein